MIREPARTIDCDQRCEIPRKVSMVEIDPTFVVSETIGRCPNEGCGKTFAVSEMADDEWEQFLATYRLEREADKRDRYRAAVVEQITEQVDCGVGGPDPYTLTDAILDALRTLDVEDRMAAMGMSPVEAGGYEFDIGWADSNEGWPYDPEPSLWAERPSDPTVS